MSDSEQTALLTEFAAQIDPLMQRILEAEDLPQMRELVNEVKWQCLQPPYFEQMWGAGELYAIWAELDDILDGWPVDYGSDTDDIAIREFRRAAHEWQAMPRTQAGIKNYAQRWNTRLAERTWS